MQHNEGGDGTEAILVSLALSGIALGVILVGAAIAAYWWPRARLFFLPLNVAVLAAQVIDGATTWVGVENPFGLDLPPYRETVFVSALIIDAFGGAFYFILKVLLGVLVVFALGAAWEVAQTRKEKIITLLVQVSLVVIGAIPVWNNISNFVRLG